MGTLQKLVAVHASVTTISTRSAISTTDQFSV
jgi:hypothetical protein